MSPVSATKSRESAVVWCLRMEKPMLAARSAFSRTSLSQAHIHVAGVGSYVSRSSTPVISRLARTANGDGDALSRM